MMTFRKTSTAALSLICLWSLASTASAQQAPGSLLVYPEFDNRAGVATVVTVTNTNGVDGVHVRVLYISRFSNQGGVLNCDDFDRTVDLVPSDTFSALTSFHNPNQTQGYIYVYAEDMMDQPITFNHLTGIVRSFDGLESIGYSVSPFCFQGIGSEGELTDLDNDGIRDLDGAEYQQSPDSLMFPSFLGQNPFIQDDLILLNLTGGTQFDATVRILSYNDNEEVFSTTLTFSCWDKLRLDQISPVFIDDFLRDFTNDDPNEVLGGGSLESGWFELDGLVAFSSLVTLNDPAVLAVLVQNIQGSTDASLPFMSGRQSNGDLLPRSILGDSAAADAVHFMQPLDLPGSFSLSRN